MTSTNLVLRPSTRIGRYQGSLSLRLIHNRSAKTVTLSDCRLYPEEWNKKTQKENLSIRVISECLGQTSEKTTLIYLDSLDNSLLDAANDKVISAVNRSPVHALSSGRL
ncbi:hypothetical protein [Parabacteroides sp.]